MPVIILYLQEFYLFYKKYMSKHLFLPYESRERDTRSNK
jgi:hypothetical protein